MTRAEWIVQCQTWKKKWPVFQKEWAANDHDHVLNLYAVLESVNHYASWKHILMGDAGSISYAGPVALKAQQGQRFIFSPAQADMGWAVPGAIGVALASKQTVICITGDGSFMSNMQELAVIRQHNLNVKVIILNNGGYLSIKNTQSKYFEGRVFGTDNKTGLWFPDFKKVAESFEFDYVKVKTAIDLKQLGDIFDNTRPTIIDCICTPDQEILPAQALKNGKQAGLHDMTPFLPDEELQKEMIVKID